VPSVLRDLLARTAETVATYDRRPGNRTVLQRLSVGVYLVDREQRIVFWNHGAEETTGYIGQQALGHQMTENFLAHVSSENRNLEGDDLLLNAALRHGRESDVRATMRHKEGYPVAKERIPSIPPIAEFLSSCST
jgi:PAS domain S-box-containing protein